MASVEVILHCLTSIRQIYGPSIFFTPNFEGGYTGYFSPIEEMALGEVILHCLTSIRRVFGPSIFSTPNFEGGYGG